MPFLHRTTRLLPIFQPLDVYKATPLATMQLHLAQSKIICVESLSAFMHLGLYGSMRHKSLFFYHRRLVSLPSLLLHLSDCCGSECLSTLAFVYIEKSEGAKKEILISPLEPASLGLFVRRCSLGKPEKTSYYEISRIRDCLNAALSTCSECALVARTRWARIMG